MNEEELSDEAFQKLMGAMMVGGFDQPLAAVAETVPKLIEEIKQHNISKAVTVLASLLTIPELQNNTYRIETLILLVLRYADGHKKLNRKTLNAWLNRYLADTSAAMFEDPPEDLFVGNIITSNGNRRVLEGVWEGNSFFLQRIVNVVSSFPDRPPFSAIRSSCHALLRLSDAIAEKSNLTRYISCEDFNYGTVALPFEGKIKKAVKSVSFSEEQLARLDISVSDLLPFVFDLEQRSDIEKFSVGYGPIERFPLLLHEKTIVVAMPTALSMAIRRMVFDFVISQGLEETFDRNLVIEFARTFSETPILGELSNIPFVPHKKSNNYVCEAGTEIDAGRYLHLIFVVDSLAEYDEHGLEVPQLDTKDLSAELQGSCDAVIKEHSDAEGFKEGVILLVSCGYGRPVSLAMPEAADKWRIEHISSYDLFVLSWAQNMSAIAFWRMLDQRDETKSKGQSIVNVNGLLNLYGWWQDTDTWMLPDGVVLGGDALMLNIPTDSQVNIRREVYQKWDFCSLPKRDGSWAACQIKDSHHYFEEDSALPLYACADDLRSRHLSVAVVVPNLIIWLTVTSAVKELSNDSVFRIWDMASKWLARTQQVFASWNIQKQTVLEIKLDLSELNDISPADVDKISEIYTRDKAASNLRVIRNKTEISITPVNDFLCVFMNEKNVGEALFVETFLKEIAIAVGYDLSPQALVKALDTIILSEDARFFHIFSAAKYRDYMREYIASKPIHLSDEDDVRAKYGLAWQVLTPQENLRFEGQKKCKDFLFKMVASIWADIKEQLQLFDREQFIEVVLSSIEAAEADLQNWRRTIRANLAIRHDKESVFSVAQRQSYKAYATNLSSRILIEMGLCECPTSGINVGELELRDLMTKVLILFRMGDLADSIGSGFLKPEIAISGSGDILTDHSVEDTVMNPIASSEEKRGLQQESENYSKNFVPADINPKTDHLFDPRFISAMKAEFGVALDDLREFRDFVENESISNQSLILHLSKSELTTECLSKTRLSKTVIESILTHFVSSPRTAWDKEPKGFSKRDWYPWKFRRRLSLLWRPIIALDNSSDPALLLSAGLIADAFAYFMRNCGQGSFDSSNFSTNEMSSWVGHKTRERGHEFEGEVAAVYKKAKWQVAEGRQLSEILGMKISEKDYGDVDLLVWNDQSPAVYVVECKNIKLAKTYSETCEQLSDFQGQKRADGTEDYLLKHLMRVEKITSEIQRLKKYVNKSDVQVCSSVVFSRPAPISYLQPDIEIPTSFLTIDELKNIVPHAPAN